MATTDLVTRTEYQTFAGLTVAADSRLDAIIEAISLAIEKYCRTLFIIRSTSQKWRRSDTSFRSAGFSDYAFKRGIWLNNYPVVSITSIVDQATTPNSITSTFYTLHPDIGFLQLWINPVPLDANSNESYWTITYTAGRFVATANVDANLKLATYLLISQIIGRPDPSVASKTVGQLSITYKDGTSGSIDIFDNVQELLSEYMAVSTLVA